MNIHKLLRTAVVYRKQACAPGGWVTRYRDSQIEECRADIALDLLVSFRDRMSVLKAQHRDLALDDTLAIYTEAVALVAYTDELMDDEDLP